MQSHGKLTVMNVIVYTFMADYRKWMYHKHPGALKREFAH